MGRLLEQLPEYLPPRTTEYGNLANKGVQSAACRLLKPKTVMQICSVSKKQYKAGIDAERSYLYSFLDILNHIILSR